MATEVVKTVKSAGGNYTSLNAWNTGEQRDLTAADEIAIAECYDFEDTTAATLDGFTTDATRYVRIYTPSAERHAGTRSASAYRLHVSTNFEQALDVRDNHVRIEGLQIKESGAQGYGLWIQAGGSSDDIRVSDTLIYDTTRSGVYINAGNDVQLMNVVVMNCGESGYAGIHMGTGGTVDAYAYNCVVANSTDNGFYVGAFRTLTCKNCYAGGSGGADYAKDANGTLNITTCYSEDGTQATTVAAFSTSAGAYFTNVTAGSEDVHIGSSSSLKDNGTDISGDANWVHPDGNVDWEGDARSTWDVGADEYVAAGGNVNVDAGVVSLVLTEYAANINAAVNVAAGVDALTLTAHNPTVSYGVLVNAGVVNLTLTPKAANVNAAINVQAGYDALMITPFAASIAAGGARIDRTPYGAMLARHRLMRMR